MPKTALITTEKKASKPILIVDKHGSLGKILAQKLKNEFLIVFVSSQNLTEENIVSIPFTKKIPSIPDNTFSHIILIPEENTKGLINIFQKKAQKDGGEFSIILDKENADKKIIDKALDFYSKTNVIIIGEVFSEDFIINPKTNLSKLIIDAKSFGKVEIPNEGTKEQAPVLLQDAVDAILEAIFVEEKERFFYVFPQNSTTVLSLALMLKKKNPGLKLDFIKENKKEDKKTLVVNGGKFLLQNPYGFEDKIKTINLDKIEVEKYKKENKKRLFKINFLPVVIFILTLLLLPVLTTPVFLMLGNFFINKNSTIAQQSYEISQNTFPVLKQELNFLSFQPLVLKFENAVSTKLSLLKIEAARNTADYKIQSVLLGRSTNPTQDLSSAIKKYKDLYILIQQQHLSSNLDKFVALSQYFPAVLGISRERNYIILLQNSQKLWPGGGKIEFYAILTINKGSVKGFKIYNAQDLTNTSNGRVEPPFAIRRYLPSKNWYFEDSNFDVDFSKDAAAAAVFLNSNSKQPVDGVIGIDSYFVKNFLSLTGQVQVDGKNVNANNFFEAVDKSTDLQFKKDFFSNFFQKFSLTNFSFQKLLSAFTISANQKHIVFAFNNQSEQLAFSLNGFGSTLSNNQSNDVDDYLGVSDANFANLYSKIGKSLNQTIAIGNDGTVSETAEITLKNTDPNNYKSYFRIILPINSKVSAISINGKIQKTTSAITDPSVYEAKKFVAPLGLELENYNEGQNTIYGFLINVSPKTTEKISLSYSFPQKVNNNSTYGIRIFKQPGVDTFSYNLNLKTNLKIVNSPSGFVANENGGSLSTIIDQDTDLNFIFLPK